MNHEDTSINKYEASMMEKRLPVLLLHQVSKTLISAYSLPQLLEEVIKNSKFILTESDKRVS